MDHYPSSTIRCDTLFVKEKDGKRRKKRKRKGSLEGQGDVPAETTSVTNGSDGLEKGSAAAGAAALRERLRPD
jgi:hypothetical protein